jgi:iron uptake system EfeUOB component EfeO/EfeM
MSRGLGRGALLTVVVLVALIAAFALFTALGVGGATKPVARTVPVTTPQPVSAIQRYSEEISVREGGGSARLSEQPPIAPARFRGPVRAYLRYAARQASRLQRDVRRLASATADGDRRVARARWRTAFARYLRLGAVYGAFGSLDTAIDGQPGGLARGTRDPGFTGLHRVELGLWDGRPLRSLRPVLRRLARDVARLRAAIPHAQITPLDYATRAHEILEDAQRDFLSGNDVPWSGEGVLATSAGVDATRVVIATLRRLLGGQESLDPVLLGLSRVRATLARIRRAHGGQLPALDGLRASERRALNGSVSWALERLQRVPGSLETTDPVQIPRLRTP